MLSAAGCLVEFYEDPAPLLLLSVMLAANQAHREAWQRNMSSAGWSCRCARSLAVGQSTREQQLVAGSQATQIPQDPLLSLWLCVHTTQMCTEQLQGGLCNTWSSACLSNTFSMPRGA